MNASSYRIFANPTSWRLFRTICSSVTTQHANPCWIKDKDRSSSPCDNNLWEWTLKVKKLKLEIFSPTRHMWIFFLSDSRIANQALKTTTNEQKKHSGIKQTSCIDRFYWGKSSSLDAKTSSWHHLANVSPFFNGSEHLSLQRESVVFLLQFD